MSGDSKTTFLHCEDVLGSSKVGDLKRRRTIQLGCKGLDLASTMYAVYRLPPEPASATISHAVTLTCNTIACCHCHLQHHCMLSLSPATPLHAVTVTCNIIACCHGHLQHHCMLSRSPATSLHAVTVTCNIIACCHGHLQHQCMLRDRFQGGFGVVTTSHATSCCCDGIFAWMHDDLLMRVKADHVQGTLENLSFLYSLFLQVPSEGAGVEVLHD
jgi:hypothetical protein